MSREIPPMSTDQVAAFVALVAHGSLRAAADALHLSEEGLRNRLLTLEERLRVPLYEKSRGRRGDVRLTPQGLRFHAKAMRFLAHARELADLFEPAPATAEIHVAASHYLAYYRLIDIVAAFQAEHAHVSVRLTTRSEREIPQAFGQDPQLAFGICAPQEFPEGLKYRPWFRTDWYCVAPPGHALLRGDRATLAELAGERLILFEPGSTGRQHVLEAFYAQGLAPTIALEATSTTVILRMIEAGLGVGIVPLLPSGAVTAGLAVAALPLADPIRPIESGIFSRAEPLDPTAQRFCDFVLAH